MGMFDTLYINIDKLPISDKEKETIGNDTEWQTKSFDCVLTEIYITDQNELKINRWNYEEVPLEDRPNPTKEGMLGFMGSVRRTNERLETMPYHGYINFYGNAGGDWYEFNAKFTDGQLQGIEGGKIEL